MTRKTKTMIGSLVLAGAAAYGIYLLSRMSTEQRTDLMAKGKRMVVDNFGKLRTVFSRSGSSPNPRINTLAEDVTLGG